MKPAFLLCLLLGLFAGACQAQERPYFVTYSHEMEEPGNLEIEFFNAVGKPPGGNRFIGSNIEFEYGATAWWTTEFYLDGQMTQHDSTIFTGYRWENRFRPLLREHWINPVIYIEFENTAPTKLCAKWSAMMARTISSNPMQRPVRKRTRTGAQADPGQQLQGMEHQRKHHRGEESFQRALGVWLCVGASRPLSLAARAHNCTFCGEKFQAGIEMYGGLGDRYSFGLNQTSHYLGPLINWEAPNGMTLSFSPQFGLNDYSIPRLYRFGVSYEIDQLFGRFRRGAR